MRLTLPVPPSKNEAHTPRAVTSKEAIISAVRRLMAGKPGAWGDVMRAIRVTVARSKKYTAYLEAVRLETHGTRPMTEEVGMAVRVHFPNRRRDMANVVDVLLDALEGIAYVNDRQVKMLLVVEGEPSAENPRVEVVVVPRPQDQGELFGAVDMQRMTELEF